MSSKYLYGVLLVLIAFSKEFLVFNEEVLVLLAFSIFIYLLVNYGGEMIADELDAIVERLGYSNRSRFLRDASLHFSEQLQRGTLESMKPDENIEGVLIVYYQHGIEQKLHDVRHSGKITVGSYNHSCLVKSHSCVDTMQASGTAEQFRGVMQQLQNTENVDRVEFVPAPMRDHGCC